MEQNTMSMFERLMRSGFEAPFGNAQSATRALMTPQRIVEEVWRVKRREATRCDRKML